MNEIKQAEYAILEAADKWARETSRIDRELTKTEEQLYNLVLEYNKLIKEKLPYVPSGKGIFIPPPPKLPKLKESQKPTIPARPIKKDQNS